ncbi:PH domain-containing protein [Blastococcus sp. SYSU D00669]
MTATAEGPQVEIRAPLVVRVTGWVVAVGGLVLVLGPGLVDAVRAGDPGAAVLRVAFAVVWLAIAVRTTGTAVRTTADGRLLVRNQLRTRTFERSEIEDVRPATGRSAQGAGLHLLLRDGTVVALQAAAPPGLGVHRRDLTRHQEALRRWLAAA